MLLIISKNSWELFICYPTNSNKPLHHHLQITKQENPPRSYLLIICNKRVNYHYHYVILIFNLFIYLILKIFDKKVKNLYLPFQIHKLFIFLFLSFLLIKFFMQIILLLNFLFIIFLLSNFIYFHLKLIREYRL